MTQRIATLVLAAGLSLGAAQAQNALDKNLQQGSGGINPARRSLSDDLRLRNAIVTGNAPGGTSFRGDVGYRAPGEFVGRLGSNDLFAFRRDSVNSGLGGMGIRGTEGLQYQFGAATGAAPGRSGLGSTFISRSGYAPSAGEIRAATPTVPSGVPLVGRPGQTLDTRASEDTRGLSLLSLRSPSAYSANRGFVPAIIATSAAPDGDTWALTASPLRGVVYRPMRADTKAGENEPRPGEAPSTRIDDRAASSVDTRFGLPAIEARFDERLGATPKSSETKSSEVKPTEIKPSETKPSGEPSTPGSITPGSTRPDSSKPETGVASNGVKGWRDRLSDLRKDLDLEARERDLKPRRAEAKSAPTKAGEDKNADRTPGEPAARGVSREDKDLIRAGAGEPLQAYAPQGFDAYAENMTRAQEHLAAGRYFDAEQRFVAAGSAKGGDAMAAIGRVNSQIGAGTFASAALSLRSVLGAHPQIIAVRYGDKIMPAPQRLAGAAERLREIIAKDRAGARDPGLVLAYIGYQTGNVAMTREGLDAFDTALAANQPGGIAPEDANTRLSDLLRDVWLNPAAAPAQVPPKPDAK